MSEQKTEDFIIRLDNVRLAFPHLWRPQQKKPTDKPAFSAAFLMPPNHPALPKLREVITACANAKWRERGPEILQGLIAGNRVCLLDGNAKPGVEGYAGNMYVNARTPTKPLIIAEDPNVQLEETDGKPYAGCFVNAQIAVWAMDSPEFGKRICAQLRGVQFARHGEAFAGGGVAQPDEFDTVTPEGADAPAPAPAGWGAPAPAAPAPAAPAPAAGDPWA